MFSKQTRRILSFLLSLIAIALVTIQANDEIVLILLLISVSLLFSTLIKSRITGIEQTRLVQAEIKNVKLFQQIEELILNIPQPLVLIDYKLNILARNHEFRSIFGEINSINELSLEQKQSIESVIFNGQISRMSLFHNNREYDLIANELTYIDQPSCIIMFNDVTVFKEAAAAQNRFIGNVSHELKTPLTSITGLSELLRTKSIDEKTQKEFLEIINQQSVRLQNLVRDLLELNKISMNKFTLQKTYFSTQDLFKSLKALFTNDLKQANLTFKFLGDNSKVYLDYRKLEQVLINLISNAINYSQANELTLKTNIDNNHLHIELTDNGIGIDPEHLPNLFDRFYTVNQDRNRQNSSTGIGLSLVKELIDKHQGTITVDSIKGQFTTFFISLPLKN